ncbi:MAG TPA: hypothetical protein VH165_09525 [Kofleriaceae bacterium]|jgi:hypothetical protein|nr:hypothetical protein [Kofleriaceae bacterium]
MATDPRARILAWACAALLVACAGPASAPSHNPAGAPAAPIAIAADQPLGWIGVAPRVKRDPGDWVPAGPQAVIVPLPAQGLAAGAALTAIDAAGHVRHVTAGAPSKLPYGCDQNQLDVVAFAGERSAGVVAGVSGATAAVAAAPGPVWLLPPDAPASWRPGPLVIGPPVAATAASRRDTVGPLVLELTRTDATHGTLAIQRAGKTIYTAPIVREPMAGAPDDPLDLRGAGIAIPVPVAAWSFGPAGPILLVLRVASYEGTHLTPLLVEADRARALPAMATYLYSCAF